MEQAQTDSIFFQLPDTLLAILDTDGHLLQVSRGWTRVLGYDCKDVEGKPFLELLHEADRDATAARLADLVEGNGTIRFFNRCRRRDGNYVGLAWSATRAGGHGMIYASANETAWSLSTDEATLPAHYVDGLTGLPNRSLFLERLEHALRRRERRDDFRFAVVYLGLDRFKVINDSLGHNLGDLLLVNVAELIKKCLRPTDMVARTSGDEFALLLEDILDPASTIRVVGRIQQKLTLPFHLHQHEVFTSVSAGIAVSAGGYVQPEQMVRDANIAMVRAKRYGGAGYVVFDKVMHEEAVQRLELEMDLRKAVEREEFQAYYQPIIALGDGRLVGFEALARWRHPSKGIVAPGQFIPAAEETGLIVPLGRWMLREACRQMHAWHQEFPELSPLTISVNLSPKQLLHPGLLEEVREILAETAIAPATVKLEITENAVLEGTEEVLARLRELKALGIQLMLDDFGTGYSSLSYLHRLPVDVIKVDRSFVSAVHQADTERSFVETIIGLAHQLKLATVCEGVEHGAQERLLREMGAEYAQGFYYSRPVVADEAKILIIRGRGESCENLNG